MSIIVGTHTSSLMESLHNLMIHQLNLTKKENSEQVNNEYEIRCEEEKENESNI